jgi:hypothetical protein
MESSVYSYTVAWLQHLGGRTSEATTTITHDTLESTWRQLNYRLDTGLCRGTNLNYTCEMENNSGVALASCFSK